MMHTIVIANTLKPTDDVRAFEKIAQSLAKTNKYEVNIIGNQRKKTSSTSNLNFYPHQLFQKSILQRLFLQFSILRKVIGLKPKILIITTYELLFISLLAKLICKSSIIYDVQEDYYKNIKYLSNHPKWTRKILSRAVRLYEKIFAYSIDQFWLAERTYLNDISFIRNKSVIIENKAQQIKITSRRSNDLRILFTGTISHYSEMLLAIKTYQLIANNNQSHELTVIGQCHDKNLKSQLESLAQKDVSINLKISEKPIPHQDILNAILSCNLGVISYQENEVNKNKVPTKLYEYSRYGLPYLIQKGTSWEEKANQLGGSIPIDFHDIDVELILQKIKNPTLLFQKEYPKEETWESQEDLIYRSMNNLIYHK